MEEKIEELEKKIDNNTNSINENTIKINGNLERINQNSYVLDILRDYKRETKRWFIAFVGVSVLLLLVLILK